MTTKIFTPRAFGALAAAIAFTLAACGGGGGTSSTSTGTDTGTTTTPTTGATAVSTGTISAFGSVFVNGHEFDTHSARIIDDDTGATITDALEVGMSVDVKNALSSTAQKPVADEIHVRPLVRGIVDASD
ncbi:MAG: hypothetical protein ABUL50_04345, partial [Rhizobacter sp.]